MPDFKYINSAWMTDLLTFLSFSWLGFWGVSILSSLTLTLTLYFFSISARLSLFSESLIFPSVLLFEAALLKNSFRGQMLSFLGISILYFILSKNDKKTLWLLPGLFFIWVNFHGEFLLGLCLFLAWSIFKIIGDYISTRNIQQFIYQSKFLSIIFFSILLATFINPFGVDIYMETFKHGYNLSQQYIVEWSQVDYQSLFWWYLYFWLFLISISSFLIIYKKLLPKYSFYIFVSFGLLLLSFQIRRYIWVTYFVSISVIKVLFDRIEGFLNKKIINILIYIVLILEAGFLIFVKVPDLKETKMDWESYCEFRLCSDASARFLENYPDKSGLFSDYNWGGWLIWNYPEIKPSIDGRMAFWIDETGYSAFDNYYGIESNYKDINLTKYNLVYISPLKPVFGRLLQLVEKGDWKIIYSDPRAFIFKRIKSPSS